MHIYDSPNYKFVMLQVILIFSNGFCFTWLLISLAICLNHFTKFTVKCFSLLHFLLVLMFLIYIKPILILAMNSAEFKQFFCICIKYCKFHETFRVGVDGKVFPWVLTTAPLYCIFMYDVLYCYLFPYLKFLIHYYSIC